MISKKIKNNRGIAILTNYNLEIKEEACDEFDGCFKLISLRANGKIKCLVLGCYIWPSSKRTIMSA